MKAIDISRYDFKSEDRVFVDANFWIFLYGINEPGNREKVKQYSQALKNMLKAGSMVCIDVLVVSEFINRYARTRHRLMIKHQQTGEKNFKKFRQSNDFTSVAKEIAGATKKILGHCQRVGNGFENLSTDDTDNLMDEYARGKSDFNDQVISLICSREQLKLVTDDKDFMSGDAEILTANERMLN